MQGNAVFPRITQLEPGAGTLCSFSGRMSFSMTYPTDSSKPKSKSSSWASQGMCEVAVFCGFPVLHIGLPSQPQTQWLGPGAAHGALRGGRSWLLMPLSGLGFSPLTCPSARDSAVALPWGSLPVSYLWPPAHASTAPCCRQLKQQPPEGLVLVSLSRSWKVQLPWCVLGRGKRHCL